MEYNYELLRKCHGLRFRATIDNKPQEGVIKVTSEGVILCYGQEDPGYLATFGRRDTLSFSKQTFSILPGDFEIVPRDPETYKDWQVGDEICGCSANNEIIFRCGELVVFKYSNDKAGNIYTCSELFKRGYRLVLTDIEQQIIRGWKKYEPQDNESADVQKMISDALKGYTPEGEIEGFPIEVVAKMLERQYEQCKVVDVSVFEDNKVTMALASGFDWDLTAEGEHFWDRVIEDRDFAEFFKKYPKAAAHGAGTPFSFKRFDPVLIRMSDKCKWFPAVFSRYGEDGGDYPFYIITVIGDDGYNQCIPLNDKTEKLIDTTEKYEGE